MNDEFTKALQMLNNEQKDAVETIYGPVMVLAGPGTGKTQILSLRIANILVKTDAKPEEILAITFTESGVQSMRKRLVSFMGSAAYRATIRTFHSFCNEIIEKYPEYIKGAMGSVPLLDDEKILILEEIFQKHTFKHIRVKDNFEELVSTASSRIEDAKKEFVTPETLRMRILLILKEITTHPSSISSRGPTKGELKADVISKIETLKKNLEICDVYEQYEHELRKRHVYDFSDMISFVITAWRDAPEFLALFQEKFQFVLVDEHQDSNNAQNTLIELLTDSYDEPNLFIVGDEKQSIYKFQGASLENFYYFKNKYTHAKIIPLISNYRSHAHILDTAHSLFKETERLISGRDQSISGIELLHFENPLHQMNDFCNRIKKDIEAGIPPHEIAILYRKNNDSATMSEFLRAHNIPHVVESDISLLDKEYIHDLYKFMKFLVNPDMNTTLLDVLHTKFVTLPYGDIASLLMQYHKTRKSHRSLYAFLNSQSHNFSNEVIVFAQSLNEAVLDLHKVMRKKSYTDLWVKLQKYVQKISLKTSMFDEIMYVDDMRHLYEFAFSFQSARKKHSLNDFLEYIETLVRHNKRIGVSSKIVKDDMVRLMTAHRSKGLEFDHVYLLNVTQKSWQGGGRDVYAWPKGALSLVFNTDDYFSKEERDIDDEDRRVFYVALTRAKKGIFMGTFDEGVDGRPNEPLKYIEELPKEFLAVKECAQSARSEYLATFKQLFLLNNNNATISEFTRSVLIEGMKNFKWSFSAMDSYMKCPWNFVCTYLLRFPSEFSYSFALGNTVHKTLETLFNRYVEEGADVFATIPEIIYGVAFHESPDDAILHKVITEAEPIVSNFVKNRRDYFDMPHKNETHLEVEYEKLILVGNIDLLLFDASNSAKVIDFKTGKALVKNSEALKKDDETGMWSKYYRQLVFYKMLLDGDGKYVMTSGSMLFIDTHENKEIIELTTPIPNEDVVVLREKLFEIHNEILRLEFWDKPYNEKECYFNEYVKVIKEKVK